MHLLRCLDSFTRFVTPNSVEPAVAAPIVLILARDPFLRASKDFDAPTHEVAPSQRTQPAPVPVSSKSVESPAPRRVVEPKGRVVVESP